MRVRGRRFKYYTMIYIHPERNFGNPTLGRSGLTVFKVWENVINDDLESLLADHPTITLGEINAVIEFVNWCEELGLMKVDESTISYDKDALYQVANLEYPPKGDLCLYCGGFIGKRAPTRIQLKDVPAPSAELVEGVAHAACLQAILSIEMPPTANVFPFVRERDVYETDQNE